MNINNQFSRRRISFVDKVISLDFTLIFLICLLGIISCFAMYSTDGGQFGYYATNHAYRFFIFFLLFIFFSFVNINFWHKYAYLIYVIFLILLLSVEFFGIEDIRANRWINLYFFNLQPSELIKIGLIIFLARYYNRLPSRHVSKIKYSLLPFLALFFPVSLVLSQPDLGTAILIATGGILVIWFVRNHVAKGFALGRV